MAAVPSIGRASFVEAQHVAPEAAATQGLYERHAAKIQSYCHHQLGSREEAEDAVQTTFMNAFRALGRGVVPEAESAWLFKIAENVCLSRRRSSWRRGRIESPSDFDVIEEVVPGPSRQRDELIGIEDALASMPEQQRRAILLREWQGLSYREIADELEVSQSAVETLIFRARRSLAQGLEQPGSLKPAKRKSFRRALHVIDFGTIIVALKALVTGSVAAQATAAAVAVTAAAGTAATVVQYTEPKHPRPARVVKAVVAPVPKPARVSIALARTPVAANLFAPAPAGEAPKPKRKPRALDQERQRQHAAARLDRRAKPNAAAPAASPAVPESTATAVVPDTQAVEPAISVEPARAEEAALPEPAGLPAAGDEGKKSEGNRKDDRQEQKRGERMHAAVPDVPPSAPAVSVLSVTDLAVAPPPESKQDRKEAKRERRKNKRNLAAATSVDPEPAPAVEPEVAPAAEEASVEEPAEAIPPVATPESSHEEKGDGEGKRKHRGRNK